MWRQRHKKRGRNAYNEKASYLFIIAHFGVKVKKMVGQLADPLFVSSSLAEVAASALVQMPVML